MLALACFSSLALGSALAASPRPQPPLAQGGSPCDCAGGAQTLYLASYSDLYRVDDYATSPKLVHVGPLPAMTDIAHVPGSPELFGIGWGGTLWRIDPATAESHAVSSFPEAARANSLEAAADGTLLARLWNAAGDLIRIDPAIPAATVVGSSGYPSAGALALDVDGSLYSVSWYPGWAPFLILVDPANGALVQRVATTYLNTSSMEIDCDGDQYFITWEGYLFRVDKATGNGTFLADFSAPGESFEGLAFLQPAVPTIASTCASSPNSTGQVARMDWSGSASVSGASLQLVADGLPAGLGLFLFSDTPTQTPFGNGTSCLGGRPHVLSPATVSSAGKLTFDLDFADLGGTGPIQPGATWYFQAWFRDPAAGGAGFDLSDGLRVTFCP